MGSRNGLFAYDNNYQYDFLGYKSFMSVPPSEASTGNRVANVFTAEKDEVHHWETKLEDVKYRKN